MGLICSRGMPVEEVFQRWFSGCEWLSVHGSRSYGCLSVWGMQMYFRWSIIVFGAKNDGVCLVILLNFLQANSVVGYVWLGWIWLGY